MKSWLKLIALGLLATSVSGCIVIVKDTTPDKPPHTAQKHGTQA